MSNPANEIEEFTTAKFDELFKEQTYKNGVTLRLIKYTQSQKQKR